MNIQKYVRPWAILTILIVLSAYHSIDAGNDLLYRIPSVKNPFSAKFTPDGKYVIGITNSWGKNRTIGIWEFKTGRPVRMFYDSAYEAYTSEEYDVLRIEPTGKHIVLGSKDKSVKLYNIQTGKLYKNLTGPDSSLISIAVDKKGMYVAAGGFSGNLWLWNLKQGKFITKLTGVKGMPAGLVFTPDGKYLIAGYNSEKITIWDVKAKKPVYTFTNKQLQKPKKVFFQYRHSLAISNDGNYLASTSRDGTIKIWKIKTGMFGFNSKLDKVLKGHAGVSRTVAFSHDDKLLASGGDDKTVILWELKSGTMLGEVKHQGRVNSVGFSKDNTFLLSASADRQSC